MLKDKDLNEYSALLASDLPAPGGGSACAYAAALAASLAGMAEVFTVNKKKFEDKKETVKEYMDEAEKLRKELIGLVDADAEGFIPLSRAYKLPKEDPTRESEIQEGLLIAARAPLDTMKTTAAVLELLEKIYDGHVSKIVESDIAAAAALAKGALMAAAVNVKVNTALLKDRVIASELNVLTDRIMTERSKAADYLFSCIYERY